MLVTLRPAIEDILPNNACNLSIKYISVDLVVTAGCEMLGPECGYASVV